MPLKLSEALNETTNHMNVLLIFQYLMKILSSDGGLAILEKLFVDHGLTPEKLKTVIDNLPDPPEPTI